MRMRLGPTSLLQDAHTQRVDLRQRLRDRHLLGGRRGRRRRRRRRRANISNPNSIEDNLKGQFPLDCYCTVFLRTVIIVLTYVHGKCHVKLM